MHACKRFVTGSSDCVQPEFSSDFASEQTTVYKSAACCGLLTNYGPEKATSLVRRIKKAFQSGRLNDLSSKSRLQCWADIVVVIIVQADQTYEANQWKE